MDGGGDTVVGVDLGGEMFAAGGCELVEADFAIGLRQAPFAGGPAVEEDFLEGGVEGAFFGGESFAGERVDALGDGVAMEGAMLEDAEDEHDEGAGGDTQSLVRHIGTIPRDAMPVGNVPGKWRSKGVLYNLSHRQ